MHYSNFMWYWTKIVFLIFAGAIGVWLLYELITFPSISRLRDENPDNIVDDRIPHLRGKGRGHASRESL